MEPLKPSDMDSVENQRVFPDYVIEAFNQCIRQSWDGSQAIVRQDVVVTAIARAGNIRKDTVYSKNLLDVEPLYRAQGWKVDYDKPGYNESYQAFYTFSRKRQ